MDPQRLLSQFLGNKADAAAAPSSSGMPMVGGLAAGGLLGLVLGNKKMRKMAGKVAGGAVGYGGAAALGALGYRAYKEWQSGRTESPVAAPTATTAAQPALPPQGSGFAVGETAAADGGPFELALVKAMIAAANADGHIGPEEQRVIFEQVGQLPLDADDKALVFDTLASPPSLAEIAALAQGPEQAAEIYLASRLAIDPDEPSEIAYLEALAARLQLPDELVMHLEQQVSAG